MIPTPAPMTIDSSVAMTPTSRLIRVPHSVSVSTERPLSSVPSG